MPDPFSLRKRRRYTEAETGTYILVSLRIDLLVGQCTVQGSTAMIASVRARRRRSRVRCCQSITVKSAESTSPSTTSAPGRIEGGGRGRGAIGTVCPIRFIITKQALQEGWDCSFAYVLAILTNPGSRSAFIAWSRPSFRRNPSTTSAQLAPRAAAGVPPSAQGACLERTCAEVPWTFCANGQDSQRRPVLGAWDGPSAR